MRVLLCVDMEGISQIRSFRELWAVFPEFEETGRAATTADALAAIRGLRAGGAREITLCEVHGPVPDTIVNSLPDGVTRIEQDELLRQLARTRAAYDAMFLLGWHARCGTPGAFMSHTGGLSLRIAVDGNPITEAHIYAWRAGLPVIGITGDAALEGQLDGILEGTPFLAVKRAVSRAEAEPIYSPDESAAAIQAFATWCVRHSPERANQRHPERLLLSISVPPRTADLIEGHHGLRRTSPAMLARSVTDWWYEADPAVRAAQEISFTPWSDAAHDATRFQSYLTRWASDAEADWLT
jgi:D-amino peptidase